jgi:predicted Zn-dependent protease
MGRAFSVALAAFLASACTTLSIDQERRLGAQMVVQARQELPLLPDPVVNGYVSGIGHRLVRAAGPQPFDYHFAVVEDPTVNAFAMPAGYIYVDTGRTTSDSAPPAGCGRPASWRRAWP